MPQLLRAHWLLPIDRPPIENGWIELHDGRIAALGRGRPPADADDLGDTALLPGLVNAHTHLELSWMAGRIPASDSMVHWIRRLMEERSNAPDDGDAEVTRAAVHAIEEARSTGTVLFGDISNTLMTPAMFAALGVDALVFHELLGFNPSDPDELVRQAWAKIDALKNSLQGSGREPHGELDFSVVPHAPYSVAPELFEAIVRAKRRTPLSVHLGESADEVEFLRTGRGPFRDLLEDLGAWNGAWQVPRCDPVRYVERFRYLAPGAIVVHGGHLTIAALERLREADAIVVTCPRSNEWVGAGLPPISHFYSSGVRVAVGTDSLASVASLNVFDELAALRRISPEISAASLLESATHVGAAALGRGADFGTLAPGKRAALAAVSVPAGTRDVEEYLVSGIDAKSIAMVNGQWSMVNENQ
jgi:aminodeoxyfutalosine deaminase